MHKGLCGFLATAAILLGCSGEAPRNLSGTRDALAPCPDTPNCVSTKGQDPRHAMEPLPYMGTREMSRDRILEILRGMKRAKVMESAADYIYARFTTRFFRFVDDVEFRFDNAARLVHFRSASRVGYYDFGLNRRRMQKISELYLKK